MSRNWKFIKFIINLNPITKFVSLICYCILVLFFFNFLIQIFFLTLIFLLIVLFNISIRKFLRKIKFILVFSFLIFLIQVLFVKQDASLFSIPFLNITLTVTNYGVKSGLILAIRFISIISSSFLFISIMDPNLFIYALMQVGLPYRYGFTFITTLRFLPLFGNELEIIGKAQKARGYQASIHPKKIIRTIKLTFMPLLVSALAKTDLLAISLEGRGFGVNKNRTFLKKIKLSNIDLFLIILLLGVTLLVIFFL